mmetsp:Transcript_28454/g.39601  ORF Transcript_28454/g.39601 Transcript_28454/m.39601 type:complete len:169 (+) Transcript_28454:679-1185(+)
MTRIRSAHHVLSIEHLLSKFGNSKSTVLLGSTGSKWSKAGNEEMETRERNQVNSKLAKISIKLTRETKTAGNSRHSSRNKMIEVPVSRSSQLQSTEANIVKSLIIKSKALIGVLNKLVERKNCVVRLDNSIGNLRRRENGEGAHHTVWVFLADFGNEKGTHTRSSSST